MYYFRFEACPLLPGVDEFGPAIFVPMEPWRVRRNWCDDVMVLAGTSGFNYFSKYSVGFSLADSLRWAYGSFRVHRSIC